MTLTLQWPWASKPAPAAEIEAAPEYEVEIILRDGSKCIQPVKFAPRGNAVWVSFYDEACWIARKIVTDGGVVEGPRGTFRNLRADEIMSATVRERVE